MLIATTERLRLRVLRPGDANELGELVADPADWVERKICQQAELGFSPWAVTRRVGSDLVGFCGLFVRPGRGITLGYAIAPGERGKGFATEAAGAVLAWADEHGHDVHASIRPPNPASERVLLKLGMRLHERRYDEDGERHAYQLPDRS